MLHLSLQINTCQHCDRRAEQKVHTPQPKPSQRVISEENKGNIGQLTSPDLVCANFLGDCGSLRAAEGWSMNQQGPETQLTICTWPLDVNLVKVWSYDCRCLDVYAETGWQQDGMQHAGPAHGWKFEDALRANVKTICSSQGQPVAICESISRRKVCVSRLCQPCIFKNVAACHELLANVPIHHHFVFAWGVPSPLENVSLKHVSLTKAVSLEGVPSTSDSRCSCKLLGTFCMLLLTWAGSWRGGCAGEGRDDVSAWSTHLL